MNRDKRDIKILGENLAFIQNSKYMSYKDFGIEIGYDRNNLANLESGTQDIQLSSLVKIAENLNADVAMLISRNFVDDEACRRKEFIQSDYLDMFVNNVKKTLRRKRMNQAQICGEYHESVSRIMTGRVKNPRISSLSAIAFKLGVSLSELLTE